MSCWPRMARSSARHRIEGSEAMSETRTEFSRPVALEELRGGLVRQTIEATDEECRGLAGRLGLAAIASLTATVTLESRKSGKIVVVAGRFEAEVTQTCVVTLEPLPRTVSESFTLRLAPEPGPDEAAIIDIDPVTEDEPEPIEGDTVDIGELVAQHLSLALDPYPRAEGASLDAEALTAGEASDDSAEDGPFAKLAKLKPKA